ncbi:hypothetical protein V8D89_008897 [Ganoderma adspersum]
MSLEDYDARFPGRKATGLPPSPSRENPGQVFPKTDPEAAPEHSTQRSGGKREPLTPEVLGNPYVLRESLTKLDHALTDVITVIQGEERSVGAAANADALVRKFSSWRDELTQIRAGHGHRGARAAQGKVVEEPEQQEGGIFAD